MWSTQAKYRVICSAKCRSLYHKECLEALLAQVNRTIGNSCTAPTQCPTPDCGGIIDYVGQIGVGKYEFRRKESSVDAEKDAKRKQREAREASVKAAKVC